MVNRKITKQNLAAVLTHVNPAQPLASAFLTKAVTVHGEMTQAPFKNRQAPAYRTLEEWVGQSIANAPGIVTTGVGGRDPGSPAKQSIREIVPVAATGNKPLTAPWGSDVQGHVNATTPGAPARLAPIQAATLPPAPAPRDTHAPANNPPADPSPAVKPGQPNDPYDGDNFNREFHSSPEKPAGGKQP
jgi:hypothetical protein